MSHDSPGHEELYQKRESLRHELEDAIAALERAVEKSPKELGEEVDIAENAIVRVRDDLIMRLRDENAPQGIDELRAVLGTINAAISLVAGVEYHSGSLEHDELELARETLQALLQEERIPDE